MASAAVLQVTRVALVDVDADEANARRRDGAAGKALAASLQRHGQVKPLVLRSKAGGRFVVVDGHGRLGAMREAGWTHADATVLDVNQKQARAIGLTLNRTAELGDWELDKLGELLESLSGDAWFDAKEAGFSDAELEQLLSPGPAVDAGQKPSRDGSVRGAVEAPDAFDERFATIATTHVFRVEVVSESTSANGVKKIIHKLLKEAKIGDVQVQLHVEV